MNDLSAVDQVLAIGGIVTETACLACFLLKGAFRVLPRVTCYLAYTSISEVIGYIFYLYRDPQSYWFAYVAVSLIGYLFEIAVGWELAVQLTGSIRPALSRLVRRISLSLLCAFAIMAAIMASIVSYRGVEVGVGIFLHCDLAFAIFRVFMFASVLGLTRILGIGWKDRCAQVTACLSLYAVFALLAEVAHEYLASMPYQYWGFAIIERVRSCVWCIAMLLLSWQMFAYQDRQDDPGSTAECNA
jgi:hypothetical protein